MNVLKLFITNIFDIDFGSISDQFINQFINSNDLDVDKLLKHPLLFTNLLYSNVWKYFYGTYPTKKDFTIFVEEHKINVHSEEPINGKLLEKIVNIFLPLKLGYLNNLDTPKLCSFVEELTEKKNNTVYIQDFLIKKWKYRFGQSNIEYSTNLFNTFIQIYKEYKLLNKILVEDKTINSLTGSYNETLTFTEFDLEYMTEYEIYQYILYNDINLFSRIIDAPSIILESDLISHEFLKNICSNYEKEINKTCCIFNLSNSKLDSFDKYYTFNIDKELVYMLPKLFKTCINISDNKYPNVVSLASKKESNIFYYLSNKNENINNNNKEILNTYDRIIVPCLDSRNSYVQTELNPKQRIYIIPNDYKDIGHNPINFVHSRIIIGTKTYQEFSKVIDPYCTKNSIQCTIPRPGNKDMKADFIIDFYEEIDPILYNINGVIPVIKPTKSLLTKQVINSLYVENIDAALESVTKLYNSPHVIKQFKENCKMLNIIHNEYFNKLLWKDHINNSCPFNENNFKNNILLYYNFIVEYFYKNLEKFLSIKMNGSSKTHIVLLDNRPNPLSVISAYFTMANLKHNYWGFKLYTSQSALEYYKHYLGKHAEIIALAELSTDTKFHIDIYNDILKSTKFWEDLDLEKCLIIQDDGIIFRENVEDFLEYDYVGGPWAKGPGNEYLEKNVNPSLVGNGGLSIRNVSKMIEITNKYEKEKHMLFFKNINRVPEDVYFVQALVKEGANLPSLEVAAKFSTEQVGFLGSLGVHKFWVYHGINVIEQYFSNIINTK
jgi:hypothetical protein